MKKVVSVGALVILGIFLSSPGTIQKVKLFWAHNSESLVPTPIHKKIITNEESVITKVVATSLPSVVTIGINKIASQTIQQNIGSGFIISSDGLIVTNKHVVEDTQVTYQVVTNDKKKYDVQKIITDPINDLAIIKINAQNLTSLKQGDSSHLQLGQMAIAIGTPLGEFPNTVTVGIVSGIGRGITAGSLLDNSIERLDNVIQTDAAINPGNSGGPLINSSGEAIGINTAVSQGGQNIGFAIPINVVKEMVKNYNQSGGKISRPFLGIRYKMIDKQTAVLNKLPEGAYITEVIQNSPADKIGIQQEDIIVAIDGNKIDGSDEISVQKTISNKKVGDQIKLTIYRGTTQHEVRVTLATFE